MRRGLLAGCLVLACTATAPQGSPPLPPAPSVSAAAIEDRSAAAPPATPCTAETCGFDVPAGICRLGIFQPPSEAGGPRCACTVDGKTCELADWKGNVPCTADADCGCTPGYRPAPTRSVSRPPGDCVARCSGGVCTAAQGMM